MDSRLVSNVVANLAQALIMALLLFILYRYINITLGVEKLGVWSLILATVSTTRLAEFGIGAGVIRYVAKFEAKNSNLNVSKVIDTASIALAVLALPVLTLSYFALKFVFGFLFDDSNLYIALEILPFALAGLFISIVSGAALGGLDGMQRMDLRALLLISAQLAFVALTVLFMPTFGLIGLAIAQLIQSLVILMGSRILLCRITPSLHFIPLRFDIFILKEIFRYGVNVQLATLCLLLLDPITKIMLALFGGAVSVGYFEMANQIVMKVRSLIVSANQAIVPYVTTVTESIGRNTKPVYILNVRILILVDSLVFSLLIMWAGYFTYFLMSAHNKDFLMLTYLLIFAWLINSFAAPAYFINMGVGKIGWNTVSHFLMGVCNIIFGVTLGLIFGAPGVFAAYFVSIVLGSMLLFLVFNKKYDIQLQDVIGFEDKLHLLKVICIVLVSAYLLTLLSTILGLISLMLFSLLLACVCYQHSIVKLVKNKLFVL